MEDDEAVAARHASGTLRTMPDPVLTIILSYADPVSLDALSTTCRRCQVLGHDADLWSRLFNVCNIRQHIRFKRAKEKKAKWTLAPARLVIKRMMAAPDIRDEILSGTQVGKMSPAQMEQAAAFQRHYRKWVLEYISRHPPEVKTQRFCKHAYLVITGTERGDHLMTFRCPACGWGVAARKEDVW